MIYDYIYGVELDGNVISRSRFVTTSMDVLIVEIITNRLKYKYLNLNNMPLTISDYIIEIRNLYGGEYDILGRYIWIVPKALNVDDVPVMYDFQCILSGDIIVMVNENIKSSLKIMDMINI